jgi:hypothetical protein
MATKEQLEAFSKDVNKQLQKHVTFTNIELAKANQQITFLTNTLSKTIAEAVVAVLQNVPLSLPQVQAKPAPQQLANPSQVSPTPKVPKSNIEKFNDNPSKFSTWLFQIEQANLIYQLTNLLYITFMGQHLTGPAFNWYQTIYTTQIAPGTLTTHEAFINLLHQQFTEQTVSQTTTLPTQILDLEKQWLFFVIDTNHDVILGVS